MGGCVEGAADGESLGAAEGTTLGSADGAADGLVDGAADGNIAKSTRIESPRNSMWLLLGAILPTTQLLVTELRAQIHSRVQLHLL
jgi:hypothetical protein